MNVVVINDNAHVNGGAAKLAIRQARGLAEREHNVFFLCAVQPVDPDLHHPRIEVHCSNQPELIANANKLQALTQGLWNVKAGKMARELFARLDPKDTVVHLHVWGRALSSSVVKEAIDRGMPPICTLHDFMLACPTGTFFLHSEGDICNLKPLSFACVTKNCDTRSYAQKLWRVGRQVIQHQWAGMPEKFTDFIVHSNLAHDVMEPFLPPGSMVHSLTPYIESLRLPAVVAGTNKSIVYLGRLVREKGVELLARCAAAEDVPLVFVGAGPLESELIEVCPKATVTGWVDSETSSSYLRQARALVFPSLWYETLGLVVLEAAAAGVPSIVPDTSAARELVEDGVTGLHFQRGNETSLRDRIRRLQNPELASRLGHAAYERFWSSDFPSYDAHIASLEEIYQSVLQRGSVA